MDRQVGSQSYRSMNWPGSLPSSIMYEVRHQIKRLKKVITRCAVISLSRWLSYSYHSSHQIFYWQKIKPWARTLVVELHCCSRCTTVCSVAAALHFGIVHHFLTCYLAVMIKKTFFANLQMRRLEEEEWQHHSVFSLTQSVKHHLLPIWIDF